MVLEPTTLSDGTFFPAGTHIAVTSKALSNDADIILGGGDPSVFDPFRYARLREDVNTPDAIHRHQFATTDTNNVHFGHVLQACPGRFFASNEIKLILAHILIMFEFKSPNKKIRPTSFTFDGAIIPNSTAKIMIHQRDIPEHDIVTMMKTM